ncbi:MAG: FecR family protein [Spirochaetota bacterium]
MRFSLNDLLVVGVGTAVITVFSFLYYKDITTKVQAGTNEQVGTVSYKRKSVERKYAGQVIWEDIENNIPVYNYDSIRTSDQSEASLHLKDGTEIKLNENSMILLAMTKNQIDIEFNKGSILANRGGAEGDVRKLNIKSGSTSISIDKSDVKLSQSKAGDLNLSVVKGIADVNTGKGAAKLGADQALVVAKGSGEVMKFDLAIKLVSPVAGAYYLTTAEKMRIDFSWQNVAGEHNVFFELAKDDLFANIIQKNEVKGNAFAVDLTKGIYYWRVRAVHKITKKEESSETRRFSVLFDEPVLLIAPENKETVTYKGVPPIINFKWTKSEIASAYRLVLAGDRSMSKIIKTQDSTQNSVMLDSAGKGVYFWRIEKLPGLKDIPKPAASGIFELNIKEREITAPPELLYPNNAKQFSKTLLEKQNITFTWKGSQEISEYNFYTAKDEKFKDIVFSGVSKVNFVQLEKNLPKGTYYWRVTGRLGEKEFTDPSLTRIFSITDTEEIKLVLPEKDAALSTDENEKTASIRFVWKGNDIKGKYKLQISVNEKFTSLYKEKIINYTGTDSVLQIEAGRYYWKVILLNDDGSAAADSRPQFFIVKNLLNTPVVVSPKDGYVINMSARDNLSLNWNKVAGANLYRISLYKIIHGKEYLIAESEEKGTSWKINDLRKLDESKFLWKLQAFEMDNKKKEIVRNSPLVKSNFKITLGKPVEKVNVNSLKIENL